MNNPLLLLVLLPVVLVVLALVAIFLLGSFIVPRRRARVTGRHSQSPDSVVQGESIHSHAQKGRPKPVGSTDSIIDAEYHIVK